MECNLSNNFSFRQFALCESQASGLESDTYTGFTFMLPCIVINIFLITNQTHYLFKFILL